MYDTLHDNWIIGFVAWIANIMRAIGVVAFMVATFAAVLLFVGFMAVVLALWSINILLWLFPLN